MAKSIKYTKVPPEVSVHLRYLYQDAGYTGKQLVQRFKQYSKSSIYRHANIRTKKVVPDRRAQNKGIPPKMSIRLQRSIIRTIPKLRKVYGTTYGMKEIRTDANVPKEISDRSVARVLYRSGYKHRTARQKGVLTEKDMKLRLQFARTACKTTTKETWTQSICFFLDGASFSHKTNPCESAKKGKRRCWRKSNEGKSIHCTAPGKKEGTGGRVAKFMVAIAYGRGVILCEEYKEKLNAKSFSAFVLNHFPACFENSSNPDGKIFLQDGDPSQNSKLAMTTLGNIGGKKFAIPPRSPDLYPIENIFHLLRIQLTKDAIETPITKETYGEHVGRVKRTLHGIPIHTIDKTIECMEKRLKEVIRLKGERTKY